MAKQVSIKKLIKEQDAFFSTTDKVFNFYQNHTRQILMVVGAIAVIVVALVVIFSLRDSKLNKSSEAYFSAIEDFDPQQTLANMEKVREDWKGTPADRAAAYAMVNSYVELLRFQEARDLLSQLYQSLPKSEESLRVLISNYLGGLSEELGDNEAALNYYLESSKLTEQSKVPYQVAASFKAELQNSIARVYTALGRDSDARNTLVFISGSFPGTLEGYMSKLKLREMEKPKEAASTPAPDQTSTTTPAPDQTTTPAPDQTESPVASPEGGG